jgi:hypothetical protein
MPIKPKSNEVPQQPLAKHATPHAPPHDPKIDVPKPENIDAIFFFIKLVFFSFFPFNCYTQNW